MQDKGEESKDYSRKVDSKAEQNQKVNEASSITSKVANRVIAGLMALFMGIMTMMRMTRNIPRKLTNATLYSAGFLDDDHEMIEKKKKTELMKRLADLEEKVIAVHGKPAEMPPEKEEMLNSALRRLDVLETELAAANKVRTRVLCVVV